MALTRPRAYQIYDIDYKQATRVVTTTNITLAGGAPNTVDSISLVANDRVLVTGQTSGAQNGIYIVQTLGTGSNGTWIRSTDTNATGELLGGTIVMVTEGAVYQDTQWKLTTNDPITIGVTALTFVQNYSTNSISAGTSNVVVFSNSNVIISSAGTANVFVVSSTGTVTTGTASVTGNITSAANVTGSNLVTAGIVYGLELSSTQSSGDEGGQVNLAIPATNTALTGQVTIDVYQNQLRFFQGNGARGAYIDLTAAAAGVGSNLLAGGGGGTPGGANTYVQFNDGGTFGGNGQFVYNKVTNIVTAGAFAANTNGTGQNFQVGDDAWIGDINQVDTIGLKGQQNAANCYIVFGNSDATGKLGRAGTGPLTYAGAFSATGDVTGGNLLTGGLISATGNITSAANVSGGNLNVTGNIVDTGALTIITGSNGNIALAPNGTGIVTISSATSATGNITSAANIAGGNANITTQINTTSVSASGNIRTAGTVSATGNITGGNILTGGLISSTSNITSAANIAGGNANITTQINTTSVSASGNIRTAGTVSATGNINGGNLISAGTITTAGNIVSSAANATANIGSATTYFNVVHAKATSAQYADVAEKYLADSPYAPGTVIEFGGANEVTKTTTSHSWRVAGVVSTNPAYIMNAGAAGNSVVEVALLGRVPCRVTGSVSKGDRMVSSDIPGVAQALDPDKYQVGCVIGKALESYDQLGIGIIEVVVGKI